MTDAELIHKSKIAWNDTKGLYIFIPIFSTDGTRLTDVAFKKENQEWIGRITQEHMTDLVKAAEILR